MQSTSIPSKNPIPFANAADASHKRVIPVPSQAPTTNDAPASFTDGFPPLTFLNRGAGGIPPNGADMNGILNQLTAWTRWLAFGNPVQFDSVFSAALPTPGYPKGSRVVSSINPGLTWVSTVENNTTDPDSGSAAGWVWEGDLGHTYNAGGGHITIGPYILNFGTATTTDNSGHITVTFDKAYTIGVLKSGASNACGGGNPSAWAGTGNETLTTMNVGMSVGGAAGGAGSPASAGTASQWWAIGL